MSRIFTGFLILGLSALLSSNGRADDNAPAKAVIEKAIKAVGGEEKLSKIKAATWKDNGKFYGFGEDGIDFTSSTTSLGTTKRAMAIEGSVAGEKFDVRIIVSDKGGWTKTGDEVEEMDDEELTEQRQQMFADWHAFINPLALKSEKFKVTPLGDMKIEGRDTVGVRVTCKGQKDMNLYYDKETGLLAKTEWQVKDTDGLVGGGEVQQEAWVSDYKEFNGIKLPTKSVVKWAGKKYVESESSDYQLVEKLEGDPFVKPE
jgi:hypothetical protein